MAKVFKLDTEMAHYNRVELYARKIEQLYLSAIREASLLAGVVNFDDKKPFAFSDYPQTKARIDNVVKNLSSQMTYVINEATGKEWYEAAANKDALVKQFTEHTKLTTAQLESFNSRNLEAMQAFQQRKIGGLGLSEKVWKYSNQFKGDLEMSLDIGLGEGKSAAELSRDIRSYLNEPDKLFRRVRDKHGELQLSQNAKKYSPGAGQYRSSYKNAMRLTRTEINTAYRTSDYLKNQQLDFVVGFKVVRSNHHFDCSVCDSLKGDYPKTFKFTNWHVQCRCHVIDILATEDEFINQQKKILAGEKNPVIQSENEVTDLPKGFTNWVADNKDRITAAKENGTLPYFLKENEAMLSIKPKEPYIYSDSSFDNLRNAGVNVRTERVTPYSYQTNMSKFDLDEFNDELMSLCKKNDISLDEVSLIHDLGKMKLSVYGNYKGDVLKPFTMERSFRRSDGVISVAHDKLVVPDELQGKGISKQLFRSLYKQYQKADVEIIKVHANKTVGGYTWCKYGFSISDSTIDSFIRQYLSTSDVIEKKAKLIVKKYFKSNPDSYTFPMNLLGDVKEFKQNLLGSDWAGVIDLKDDVQRSVFETYINYK